MMVKIAQSSGLALKRAGIHVLKGQRVNLVGRLGLASLLGLLGQKNGLDVGQATTLGDGHPTEELVQLLVVADGELQVTRDDARLLVVAGSVAGQLENLSGEVFEDGSQVDWGAGTDTLGVVALAEQSVHTANRELKTGAGRPGLGLRARFSTFTTSRHVEEKFMRSDSAQKMRVCIIKESLFLNGHWVFNSDWILQIQHLNLIGQELFCKWCLLYIFSSYFNSCSIGQFQCVKVSGIGHFRQGIAFIAVT